MTLGDVIAALDGAGLVITDPEAIEQELKRLGIDKETWIESPDDHGPSDE